MGVETAVAIYVATKLRDRLEDGLVSAVVDRWSKRRASAFLDSFASALKLEAESVGDPDVVDSMLDELVNDDVKSEALFDAYRRVVLAATKEVGPRVIALLTADLINASELSSFNDEVILRAGELFSDSDFDEFVDFFEGRAEAQPRNGEEEGSIIVEWSKEELDSNAMSGGREYDISPLDLGDALGLWALRLQAVGGVSVSVRQKEEKYGLSHYVDEPGSIRTVTTRIHFFSGTRYFLWLAARARASVGNGEVSRARPDAG